MLHQLKTDRVAQLMLLGVIVAGCFACAMISATAAVLIAPSFNPSAQVAQNAPSEQPKSPEAPAAAPKPTAQPTPAPKPTNTPVASNVNTSSEVEPVLIGNLRTYVDGDKLNVLFSLYDQNNGFTSASGTANVTIVSENGPSVYSESHAVNKNDFRIYTHNLSGQQFLAYGWQIPLSKIEKGNNSSGRLSLEFSTVDVRFEPLEDNLYGLPKYSNEELGAFASQGFEQNAITLNMTKQIDNYLAVTVQRIGLMTFNEYDGEKTYIRIDIEARNIGPEKIDFFYPDPIILGKSSNQFEKAHVSTNDFQGAFDEGVDIFPGVVKTGAFFFETSGNPQLDLKDLIISTGLQSYSKQSREIGNGQALMYDDEYVFSFDLSKVNLQR